MNTFYEGFDGRFYDDGIRAFSRTTHETDIAHSIHQKISDCQNAKHFTCQMRFCRHEMHLPLRSFLFFFTNQNATCRHRLRYKEVKKVAQWPTKARCRLMLERWGKNTVDAARQLRSGKAATQNNHVILDMIMSQSDTTCLSFITSFWSCLEFTCNNACAASISRQEPCIPVLMVSS